MKITGLIMIVVGWLLLVFNALAYLGGGPKPPPDKDTVSLVAFYIGFNMGFVLAITLLLVGYTLRRKAKHKKEKADLLSNFLIDKSGNSGNI
jgi:predicted permease